LEGFRGLILLHATLAEQIEIAEFAQQTGLTFDDEYQAFFAQRLNVPVVSFDSDYDGIVPRVEPSEILRRR
jgi:predicted nucleic acid-binding protein